MKGGIYQVKGGHYVRFGRDHTRHFKDLGDAERHLNFIRVQTDRGEFDQRDWQNDKPLAFCNLAERWLLKKKKTVKPQSYRNLELFIFQAIKTWGNLNIKAVGDVEIDDFIFERDDISEKTRANMRSCLHDFFKWGCKRARCRVPDIPIIEFELGWRNIIDIETQSAVLDEVHKISFHRNPKIWLGIKWLSVYISIRPGELLNLKERHINTKLGCFIIPDPKEKKPKLPPILDEDIELINSMPRGLPDMYFFRHVPGISGATAGKQFGPRYLYRWWKKACGRLHVNNVDLYGGTRHSTITALGEYFHEDELKNHGSFHASKAILRYMQKRRDISVNIYQRAADMKNNPEQHVNNLLGAQKNGKLLDFK